MSRNTCHAFNLAADSAAISFLKCATSSLLQGQTDTLFGRKRGASTGWREGEIEGGEGAGAGGGRRFTKYRSGPAVPLAGGLSLPTRFKIYIRFIYLVRENAFIDKALAF